MAESWDLLRRGLSKRLEAALAAGSLPDADPSAAEAVKTYLAGGTGSGTDASGSVEMFGRVVALCALRGVDAAAPSPLAMYAEALTLRRLRGVRASGVAALAHWAELIDEHREAAAEEAGGSGSSSCGDGASDDGPAGVGSDGGCDPAESEFDLEGALRSRATAEEAEAAELAERLAEAAPGFEVRRRGGCASEQVAEAQRSCSCAAVCSAALKALRDLLVRIDGHSLRCSKPCPPPTPALCLSRGSASCLALPQSRTAASPLASYPSTPRRTLGWRAAPRPVAALTAPFSPEAAMRFFSVHAPGLLRRLS